MEPLYTPEEAADLLKVSRRAIIIWLQTGKLKGLKAGNRWRIEENELKAFLKGEGIAKDIKREN